MKWNKTFFVLTVCFALPWGGASGAQPASSHASQLVQNLRATRKGNKVLLTWSQPRVLRDRQSVMDHPVSRVCRRLSSAGATASNYTRTCAQAMGEVDAEKTGGAVVRAVREERNNEITLRFTDTLSEEPKRADPLQFAVYTIEIRDSHGRNAGFSNPVSVSLAPILSVEGLHSELDTHGVYLIWEDQIESQPPSVQFDYKLYRQEKNRSKVAVQYLRGVIHTREGTRWTGVDTSTESGKTYSYWVTPVTRVYSGGQLIAELEGEDSAPIEVTTHDVFPPAVPERLLALLSPGPVKRFVDLLWAPNIEKDLAGYNVYRREEGGPVARINTKPITMLSFQDTSVVAGHSYFYCLSAVDAKGNESAKSLEIAAVLP